MVLVLLADGFEEIEALTPVDMLRRAGVEVKTVGIGTKNPTGSHGISVEADILPEEADLSKLDMVIFPGGMPGSLNLDASPFTDKVLSAAKDNGARIAAICAAPLVLGRRSILKGHKATCYPGFESELIGAEVSSDGVVTDGLITTGKGMGVALAFSKELVGLLTSFEISDKLSSAIME
jgi:4-methyl-5(b-hydroxyethyl)-thiazole monophosphate biosynthesis